MPIGHAPTCIRRPSISHQSPPADLPALAAAMQSRKLSASVSVCTNHIIGPKRAKDSLIGWQYAGHFRPWPGDMQKKAYPAGAAHLAQKTRHGSEMIIMHPDDIVATQQLMKLPGKMLVHPEIGGRVCPSPPKRLGDGYIGRTAFRL
jgi:hypothetical protein